MNSKESNFWNSADDSSIVSDSIPSYMLDPDSYENAIWNNLAGSFVFPSNGTAFTTAAWNTSCF